jgi:hypothetical protein
MQTTAVRTGTRTLRLPTADRWAVAYTTNATHCNMTARRNGRRTLESIAVFEPDDVFVPVVVRERLAEANVEGIVKTDTGPHSHF